MLTYQRTIFEKAQELTSDIFAQLIIDDGLLAQLRRISELYASGGKKAIAGAKRALPAIIWQVARFDPSMSERKGMGTWVKNETAHLNGLFMLDIDDVDDPRGLFRQWVEPVRQELLADGGYHADGEILRRWADPLGIKHVAVTSSQHGLRVVAVASMDGDIAWNQKRLSSLLGVTSDEACHDAARRSFCPGFEDILYLNQDIFNYDNPEYDKKFGQGPLQPPQGNGPLQPPPTGGGSQTTQQPSNNLPQLGEAGGGLLFNGVSYRDIIARYFEAGGGEPGVGSRHQRLLQLAGALRYITDNNPAFLLRALQEHPLCKAYYDEDPRDLTAIADSVCQRQTYPSLPKRLVEALKAAGVQQPDAKADAEPHGLAAPDYDGYAQRLLPLLGDSPGLREAVADIPDRLKLGGVLAATAMLGTYLTRCWWEHFDGRLYRLSFLTYIIGGPASGKSFLTELDRLLMAPMLVADRVGRAAEQQYKEEQRRRKANEKLPEMPHPVIRYCPSSTSNAILYRRLRDAVDESLEDPYTGEPIHLHLITVESELATALRAQVGSWAGKNDLELKAFQNEFAGVDFANSDSTNGPLQVNWNQVISGTPESLSRKIKPTNVLDGLVTRLSLFLMPEARHQMIERRRYHRDPDRECYLRSLGYKLEEVRGELVVPRLVDFCYDYERELTVRGDALDDSVLDHFRKRIPLIMMRHALVRIVLRQLDKARRGEQLEVEDSDLAYARLIGDWCLEMQLFMFGQMFVEADEKARGVFAPAKMHAATRQCYNSLPADFTAQTLIEMNLAKDANSARVKIARWLEKGLVEKTDNGYKKKVERV